MGFPDTHSARHEKGNPQEPQNEKMKHYITPALAALLIPTSVQASLIINGDFTDPSTNTTTNRIEGSMVGGGWVAQNTGWDLMPMTFRSWNKGAPSSTASN